MPLLIKTCFQEIPHEDIEPGDVILHNDPYRGGLHCPEHTFFKPFFDGDELWASLSASAMSPRSAAWCRVRSAARRRRSSTRGCGCRRSRPRRPRKDVDEVWKLLLANTRTPRQNYGDLRAMIGSVDLGVDRIEQIVRKYGCGVFKSTCEDLMDYAERRMRAELSAFPDGKYSFHDVIENDGIEAVPYTVAIDLHINGDELVADYDRSSKQAKGPINATLGVATGAVYNGMLHVTDPSIPKNSGCFRPIRVVSPPGRVTNVDYPGPLVAGNTETHPRLANITIGAMSNCAPERAMASESCTGTNFVFGGEHPEYDEYFACYDIMSGGWGGRAGHDGNDCVIAINGNCRFNPTEVFETRFPLRVEDCAMDTDSGGAGEFRGGLGYTRTLLITEVEITGSQCSDRHEVRPFALFGGEPGGNGATLIQKAGSDAWLTVKELYGKVSSSKYANRPLPAGRPHPPHGTRRRRLWRPGEARPGGRRPRRGRGLCQRRGGRAALRPKGGRGLMRIAILGAGAMGGMFGTRFARAGAEVVLYDRDEAHVAAIAANGSRWSCPARRRSRCACRQRPRSRRSAPSTSPRWWSTALRRATQHSSQRRSSARQASR
ncbi:MAG: hydantoinase B/oxoprolinase family protein [Geminicoccaceae bacterium]